MASLTINNPITEVYFMAKYQELLGEGYSTIDIISTLFKVVSRMPELHEWLKLEYLKVRLKVFSGTL